MDFDDAFEKLKIHEGGYSNDKNDQGGETKYGISKKQYPAEDILNLTLERAKEIYHRDYWETAGCDAVPDPIRFDLFDTAVNSGVRTAIKLLQRAVGEIEDGLLGPHTLLALQSVPTSRTLARFNGHRLEYLTNSDYWSHFGKGWARRIASNLQDV